MTATPPLKSPNAQSLANQEILKFVNQRCLARWTDLFSAFGEGPEDSRAARHRFGKKLEYLVYTGRLQATGRGMYRMFALGSDAHAAVPARGRTNTQAGQCSGVAVLTEALNPQLLRFAGQLVPPRQFNTMDAPPYVPPAHTSARPGSLDYKRYASHGHQC